MGRVRGRLLRYKGEWCCKCEDYAYHHVMCKHMWLVIPSYEKQAKEKMTRIISPIDEVECPGCHSLNIKKDGLRHNEYGNLLVLLEYSYNHRFFFQIVNLIYLRKSFIKRNNFICFTFYSK